MTETLGIDLDINPFEAVVVEEEDGTRHFDLSTFPRVEHLLIGKPVDVVAESVKMLCGICPISHHLAGMRALDQIYGATHLPETTLDVRLLLHYASVLDIAAGRLLFTNREVAVAAKKVARDACAAIGMTGHFPSVAVPGGVTQAATEWDLEPLHRLVGKLKEVLNTSPAHVSSGYVGTNVALVSRNGELNPLGDIVGVIRDGSFSSFPVTDWTARVVESRPGSVSPFPLLDGQSYRVGPRARAAFSSVDGDTIAELYDAAVAMVELAAKPSLYGDDLRADVSETPVSQTGTGIVDSPRGILVHHYEIDENGILTGAQILTPTAQNDPWLTQMLTDAHTEEEMERAIRIADPCVPCVSAPPGKMTIKVKED